MPESDQCNNTRIFPINRYTGTDADASNMAVIEVKMVTGFSIDKDTLAALEDDDFVDPRVKPFSFRKYEIAGKSVLFYFDQVSSSALSFLLINHPVFNTYLTAIGLVM